MEEVRKRLEAMRRQWQKGELSTPVRTKMASLLQGEETPPPPTCLSYTHFTALEAGEISVAQSIQVSLMVDHTSEVTQTMMHGKWDC